MDSKQILPLLGLCLRGGRLAVGEEPVEAVARARDARVLFLASDAADNTRRRCQHFAQAGDCLWLQLPFTKAELGQAVGRRAAAIVAVTDIGLAANIVHRLEALDSAKYGEAAARLDLKAKRAAERRAEQQAHERNLRRGKRRAKTPPVRSDAPPPQEPKRTGREERPPHPPGGPKRPHQSRPAKDKRPRPKADPYAHSRPVKKGKGSFRKKKEG